MPDTKHYASTLRYKFIALLCLIFAAGFGWNLTRRFAVETLFFFGLSAALLAWAMIVMLSHVDVTADSIVLVSPGRASRPVGFRQLISVSENGRFNSVITLIYHPHRADGLLDLDNAHSLILPAVTDQQELLERLEASLPP